MNFLSFLIKRPIACSMILLVFVFLGVVSIYELPVNLFPNITRPMLKVETVYENFSPSEIENKVTRPLEDELSFVENVTKMESLSGQEKSQIFLTFRWHTDMEFAALDVREKIDRIVHELPDDVTAPVIEKMTPNAKPVLVIHMIPEKISLLELRQFSES